MLGHLHCESRHCAGLRDNKTHLYGCRHTAKHIGFSQSSSKGKDSLYAVLDSVTVGLIGPHSHPLLWNAAVNENGTIVALYEGYF